MNIGILCSAPRQDEFMPILCIMATYSQRMSAIEELLGLQMGETELLLRGLHSVIDISTRKDRIASYHASFLDFLNNPRRSQKFHVDSLKNRMYLARCFLHFAAGRYRDKNMVFREPEPRHSQEIINSKLMDLLRSLPPSVELWPLIGRMNPEHIFNPKFRDLNIMLSWLKNIPSTPRDLIKL
ncbi:hypothetical protein B0H14DRAFT_138212 [Mycena olivaceomarginata]|nr:hypothetical protein B0H14DRAFT_138212 [Mycena olivaceomarginata]